MSCVLRVWGSNFNVDDFFTNSSIHPINIWHRGEPKFKSNPKSKTKDNSGCTIELSSANFSELNVQIQQTINFCNSHKEFLTNLVSYTGVEHAVADFGVQNKPDAWCSYQFDKELLSLLSEIGISLCVSVYPVEMENNEKET